MMTTKENVFFCRGKHDLIAQVSKEEEQECPVCKERMINNGWMESEGKEREVE